MFTCFAYDTIPEAACASQRLHTIPFGHAMCHLLFPLTRRVFSPCHIFCQIALSLPRVAKGFCSQQILPFNLPPVLLPPPRICQCFLPPTLPLHLPPSVFFHPCCLADCHRHCHCFCPQGCHLCCHQIWGPNRALFLNFRYYIIIIYIYVVSCKC